MTTNDPETVFIAPEPGTPEYAALPRWRVYRQQLVVHSIVVGAPSAELAAEEALRWEAAEGLHFYSQEFHLNGEVEWLNPARPAAGWARREDAAERVPDDTPLAGNA